MKNNAHSTYTGSMAADSPIEQFKNAMLNVGITPPDEIIPDGKLHRFKIDGKLNGAYVLHLDGRAAGWFQDFKQGIKEKWKLDGYTQTFTAEQKAEFKAQRQKIEAEQAAELKAQYDVTAGKARYIWSQAKPATTHPYLTLKNINPHGARIAQDDRLIIPLLDETVEIVNLQFIDNKGGKRFMKGGRKKGCFYAIGAKSERICIAEGLATAASIYEATGQQTFVAFDAGNLKPVAKLVRSKFPGAEIVIMADNDLSGIGQDKAKEAADSVAGHVMVCPIEGMDFNDYLNSDSKAAAWTPV